MRSVSRRAAVGFAGIAQSKPSAKRISGVSAVVGRRGLNENTNGLLRQFFPKGTDFARISYRQVARAERLLDERPRKSLGYKTPGEALAKKRAAIGT